MKKTLFAFCSMIAAAVMAEEPQVLLKNAGFEKMAGKNPANWICVVDGQDLSVAGDQNVKVLKLNRKTAGKPCMLVQRELPLAQNKTYAVSCEVRSEDMGSGMVYAEWRTKLADGKFKHTSVNAKPVHGETEWKEVLFEIGKRPEDAELPYIVLVTSANTMEFRNLKITEL